MIEVVHADAFDASGVLIHQANCHHSMASGIAKAVRERFPEAYAADTATVKGDLGKLGTFSAAAVERPGSALKWIVNLYSQYGYQDGDRRTSYDAMFAGLIKVRDDGRFAGLDFAVPSRIGCGLAGGNWGVVQAILRAVFSEPFGQGARQPMLRIHEKPE
jgi:O-acetyl-ADP-ribose deacetylase (regulator of RNase III)